VLSGFGLIALAVSTTFGAFTDSATVGLGATGSVGGSYDIAFLDGANAVQQGNPTPFAINTTGVAKVLVGPLTGSAKISTRVVTTTAATGPVVLKLYNAFSGTRPTDPGYSGPGVDPYDVALFSIWVDGTQVATNVTATAFNVAGHSMPTWVTGTAKTIEVQMTLPRNLSNPYYFNRALVLGLQFDGST
jgi:hypothetical protein